MRVALTGTPGTGKTTVATALSSELQVVHVNEHIDTVSTEFDPVRESAIVDIDQLNAAFEGMDDVILESHLAHHLEVDRVIVLRCHPDELVVRLRERGVSDRSIDENAESEAIDLILSEAVTHHGPEAVFEIDTTGRSIEAVVNDVEAALDGERRADLGACDFTDYLHDT